MLPSLNKKRTFLWYLRRHQKTIATVYFWPVYFWGEAQIPVILTQRLVSFMGAGQTEKPIEKQLNIIHIGWHGNFPRKNTPRNRAFQ